MQIVTLGIGGLPLDLTPFILSGLQTAFPAQGFAINNTHISRMTKGDWADEAGDAQALDGVTPLARWRRHTWRADVLDAAEWNTLRALEGTKVSIRTPAYDDRNAANYRAYYGVDFESLDGQHSGPVVVGVTVEFLVRL